MLAGSRADRLAVRRRVAMWAMIIKEFRQVRRDRRTLAMMIVMPVLLLVVLGYAASFDVKSIPVVVAGPQASVIARQLPPLFHVVQSAPGQGQGWARDQLRDGHRDAHRSPRENCSP